MQSTCGLCHVPDCQRTLSLAKFVCTKGDDEKCAWEGVGCGQDKEMGYIPAEIEGVSVYQEGGT
jgi:hypothetical protein